MRNKMIMAIAALPMVAVAGAPAGYYSNCEGLAGAQLLRALETAISDHESVGYSGLWSLYETSDVYPDGKIWDMYSTKHWTFSKEQCGTYSVVGDCYNREHSFPKSWFNDAYPMYCDAFHIYPTDGKVNGQRSNYPYGECANGTTLKGSGSVTALGRLGNSTFPGYSGVVFEPDDEYKGDFARSYFYMAACYNSLIDDWSSDMLAGNSYPAFKTWAVNLLLKWHRQDPVSDKELDRNEAVYARQRNRNPFIDHPELAEYIWGDKKDGNWTSSGALTAAFAQPIEGTVYDFGCLTTGAEKILNINVKGVNLTEVVTMSCVSPFYTLDRASIPAAEANAAGGAILPVTWDAEDPGEYTSQLTLISGSATTTVTIIGQSMPGITANAASDITDRSFVASWPYVADEFDDGTYRLCYRKKTDDAPLIINVPAKDESYEVTGLAPSTEYVYWMESKTTTSNIVNFTTGFPVPSIQLLYDGELFVDGTPGEPSQAYELLVDAENIEGDITVEVTAPFEVSTDKTNWSQTVTISAEEDRFYLRINAADTGSYSTTVKLTAGTYVNDDIEVHGTVTEYLGFVEDFESSAEGCDTYNGCEYHGRTMDWYLTNAGIWESDKDDARSGIHCVRMGKTATSSIEMLSDKGHGLGKVTVYAKRWTSKEGDCVFRIEYSTDGGATWRETDSKTVDSDDYQQYDFIINTTGEGRVRLQQISGARFIIDDIVITDFTTGLDGVESDYHSWDAYCLDGRMVIETAKPQAVRIYDMDGVQYHNAVAKAGRSVLDLPAGLYLIWVEDFSRRVLVK